MPVNLHFHASKLGLSPPPQENGTPASGERSSRLVRTALLPPSERRSRPERTVLSTQERRSDYDMHSSASV